MKKWGIIALLAVTAVASASVATAATKLTLIVNGKVAAAETKLIDGVTYVPLRAAAELLGSTVSYDAESSTITITSAGSTAATPDVQTEKDLVFSETEIKKGRFSWEGATKITNTSSVNYGFITFTAVFYDANGKRVGTAKGVVTELEKGDSRVINLLTTDDLTGYEKIEFQVDTKL
ncbi:copper amine oxidase N-terminal domain-containing protein [Paenibacillus sp. TRM 82003]|nr:copper amine oxidase N-terminal domain-containing protein [Paenibacillus sp. TRM 82003]